VFSILSTIFFLLLTFPLSVSFADSNELSIQPFTSSSTGMEFVYLSAGCTQIGSNNGFHFEQPVHEVCVDAFFIGRYEVTQKQWVKIMGDNPSKFQGENRPVDRVSWLDAQAFIDKLNEREGTNLYRLTREAEWEYAARAGTSTEYYWGDKWMTIIFGITARPILRLMMWGPRNPTPLVFTIC
jgi:formylglycine-generating enzyme required for sulfatase activity